MKEIQIMSKEELKKVEGGGVLDFVIKNILWETGKEAAKASYKIGKHILKKMEGDGKAHYNGNPKGRQRRR